MYRDYFTSASEHRKFKQLAALANTGSLTAGEWAELRAHLNDCEACRLTYQQYLVISKEGMLHLATHYNHPTENEIWDDTGVREKLLARVRGNEEPIFSEATAMGSVAKLRLDSTLLRPMKRKISIGIALAACVVIATAPGAFRRDARTRNGLQQVQRPVESPFQKETAEKKTQNVLPNLPGTAFSHLQKETLEKEQELGKMRSALRTLQERADRLADEGNAKDKQLLEVSRERDSLDTQLHSTEQSYQNVQAELSTLHGEHNKAFQEIDSLESQIEELNAANRDQERRLTDEEQYLSSDRDIRELMGARNLYIADVFDVDGASRTRKLFGRVFYTKGKSLVFYAFDLDSDPGLNNASTLQAWGQKDTSRGDQGKPMGLGILYKDSESNRRWVMRCDDPIRLAEIDAVFVTVEPHGGSLKPTGKPFLYALLRREANHP
ncbi:MAG TPA: hypothetical protein VFE02_06225 [Candidatus Acidoferrales bacterium]|jgi:archaellum component FlaC|nr:hypothetical protein [Candidatus Acidoferrales bacterium]